MKKKGISVSTLFLLLVIAGSAFAQDRHYYQTDFPKEEFAARRAKLFERIGKNAIALIQGAKGTGDFNVFRQSNEFYYLSGLETPHAYLLLDGRNQKTTVYLPHRDAGRELNEGKILSAEDGELIKELTGIDQVRSIESLSLDLVGKGLLRPPAPILYTPLSPAEIGTDSRDELLNEQARVSSNPWDGLPSREARFRELLSLRVPQFEVRDLSPILDGLRNIKSKSEIELIRKATEIAGLAIIEAMRSTEPAVYEYQLDAAAKYIFYLHGARGDGYASIIGGGSNGYMGHYFRKADKLKDGDLVLMDYAPDYRYYTSDVTRMWPVNGKYTKGQRALTDFVLAYRDALFKYIRPGVTSDFVLDSAAKDMTQYLTGASFENAAHLKAVTEGLKFRGHFQHPVGMAVHDVGQVRGIKLEPGMVFTIDPMIWIHEERLYVRIEDVVVVTADGAENLSAFVPSKIEDIERTMTEKGLIQFRPATSLPLKK
ncbi:MAG: aminopeptidase P N-terminal domain-containing protein [Pyrinomonadaceae bacterium]|nr:aminopeptidase P N-terminal domain-containing protein [Acidobacteriota bacterium]MBP7376915.1 aminopeptidase P N-terminal domain-containing protein [Pyrinomonadaceae bacterium]